MICSGLIISIENNERRFYTYMKGTVKVIDKYTLLMECEICGKKHSPILEEGRIPKESYYCTKGCKYPEDRLKEKE
jgi:hypothetical protein